jgi:hypothetical protein
MIEIWACSMQSVNRAVWFRNERIRVPTVSINQTWPESVRSIIYPLVVAGACRASRRVFDLSFSTTLARAYFDICTLHRHVSA